METIWKAIEETGDVLLQYRNVPRRTGRLPSGAQEETAKEVRSWFPDSRTIREPAPTPRLSHGAS